ncbi:MAG: DUF2442 domain-containing protein [Pedosphaera sp.]|nr:DUF2442 domain-containing protein [Pedosphaera sp.]
MGSCRWLSQASGGGSRGLAGKEHGVDSPKSGAESFAVTSATDKAAQDRVKSFEPVVPFSLRVRFADGLERIINFAPMLAGELFGPLRDRAVFFQSRLDPEVHTLVWPNGGDFDRATLHDWPEHEAAFRAAALRWESQPVVA